MLSITFFFISWLKFLSYLLYEEETHKSLLDCNPEMFVKLEGIKVGEWEIKNDQRYTTLLIMFPSMLYYWRWLNTHHETIRLFFQCNILFHFPILKKCTNWSQFTELKQKWNWDFNSLLIFLLEHLIIFKLCSNCVFLFLTNINLHSSMLFVASDEVIN